MNWIVSVDMTLFLLPWARRPISLLRALSHLSLSFPVSRSSIDALVPSSLRMERLFAC